MTFLRATHIAIAVVQALLISIARAQSDHHFLGCFLRSSEDALTAPQYLDRACMDLTAPRHCRSGLPFYRLPLQEDQSFLDCLSFCSSKGLDRAGIVSPEHECRCGASPSNNVFTNKKAGHRLLLPPVMPPGTVDQNNCSVLVWQWDASKSDGGDAAQHKLYLSANDYAYIDSIVEGRDVSERYWDKDEPPKPPDNITIPAGMPAAEGECQNSSPTGIKDNDGQDMSCDQLKVWCNNGNLGSTIQRVCPISCGVCSSPGGWLPCYPHNCGDGGGPWLLKGSDGLVNIPYYFEPNLDETRKEVFRAATQMWSDNTCLRFTESSSSTPSARISVGAYDLNSCSGTVGYPGPGKTAKANLGWCSAMNSKGNVAHELGHLIGSDHTHQRPDAGKPYRLPTGTSVGPFIDIHMQDIDPNWQPFYKALPYAYVGSSTRGYAPYDFESIMHYPEDGKNFNCVNPAYDSVVGQRSHLSAGDIDRANDMYQCQGTPSPPPPPSPPPQPPSPPPAPCTDQPAHAAECPGWSGAGYCNRQSPYYANMQYYCRKTCGFCR